MIEGADVPRRGLASSPLSGLQRLLQLLSLPSRAPSGEPAADDAPSYAYTPRPSFSPTGGADTARPTDDHDDHHHPNDIGDDDNDGDGDDRPAGGGDGRVGGGGDGDDDDGMLTHETMIVVLASQSAIIALLVVVGVVACLCHRSDGDGGGCCDKRGTARGRRSGECLRAPRA